MPSLTNNTKYTSTLWIRRTYRGKQVWWWARLRETSHYNDYDEYIKEGHWQQLHSIQLDKNQVRTLKVESNLSSSMKEGLNKSAKVNANLFFISQEDLPVIDPNSANTRWKFIISSSMWPIGDTINHRRRLKDIKNIFNGLLQARFI